ncbi:insulinase family protein [Schleiferiaceae bacterium]|jgi:predicted Zn-dependent peptidase|nr:insulinase family protein [Schleiferiaceae bacterium]MDB2473025.1 insulinase family protein [Schleiferiaceae bacterium]
MKKYIYSLIAVVVAFSLTAQTTIDRSTAPSPGPARVPTIASYESFELKNGLKVFVVEDHKLPRISMSLILDRDPIVEGEKAGYVAIAGDLLGSGTTTRTKAQLDEEVDFMGARFSTSASSMNVGGLSKYTDDLVEIMSDVLLNPSFETEEFEKLKSQMTSGLKANADDPDAIAGNLRGATLYGLEHPYGEVMTESTVEAVTLEDCKNYFSSYFRPNIAYMVVIGDITVKDAKKKLSKALKGWKASDVPAHDYEKTSVPSAGRIVMVDKPSAVQSVVWLGNVIDLPQGHPDIEPLRIANQILGGGMSGRLFTNLREDKAFTYGAYSSFGIDELNSTFGASAKVRNEVTDSAIVEFLMEIGRMRTESVTEEDLIAAKASLSGAFGRSLESTSSAANFALNIARYGLPSDYYNNYLARLEAVTAEDVMRVSNQYMKTDNLTISVVGKAQDVAAGLAAFGEVEYYDAEGMPTDAPTFLFMPEGITLETVFAKYYEAMGGVDVLSSLKAMDMKAHLEIPGMPGQLKMRTAKITPNKFMMEQSMQGMTVMKMTYVDGVGKQSGMQGEKELEGEELEDLKKQASFVVDELAWMQDLESFTFDGQTLMDGKAVYQVSEGEKTRYFEVETGLFYKSTETTETPEGDMAVSMTVEEWGEYNGIKMPKVSKQSAGQQTFTIIVDSVEFGDDVKAKLFK